MATKILLIYSLGMYGFLILMGVLVRVFKLDIVFGKLAESFKRMSIAAEKEEIEDEPPIEKELFESIGAKEGRDVKKGLVALNKAIKSIKKNLRIFEEALDNPETFKKKDFLEEMKSVLSEAEEAIKESKKALMESKEEYKYNEDLLRVLEKFESEVLTLEGKIREIQMTIGIGKIYHSDEE